MHFFVEREDQGHAAADVRTALPMAMANPTASSDILKCATGSATSPRHEQHQDAESGPRDAVESSSPQSDEDLRPSLGAAAMGFSKISSHVFEAGDHVRCETKGAAR
jgi:hypothetical protein